MGRIFWDHVRAGIDTQHLSIAVSGREDKIKSCEAARINHIRIFEAERRFSWRFLASRQHARTNRTSSRQRDPVLPPLTQMLHAVTWASSCSSIWGRCRDSMAVATDADMQQDPGLFKANAPRSREIAPQHRQPSHQLRTRSPVSSAASPQAGRSIGSRRLWRARSASIPGAQSRPALGQWCSCRSLQHWICFRLTSSIGAKYTPFVKAYF